MRNYSSSHRLTTLLSMLSCILISTESIGGVIYESGLVGDVGISNEDRIDGNIPGSNISGSVYSGARFQIHTQTQITAVGGHFSSGNDGGSFLGAIVPLSSATDLPRGDPLSQEDIVANAVIDFPDISSVVVGDIDVILYPGWYGVVFGSDALGVAGKGVALRNNIPFNPEDMIGWQAGLGWGPRDRTAGQYYVVKGVVVPEPTGLSIVVAVLISVGTHRLRR